MEVYGAERKVQLPFVMGVLADLRGNAGEAPAPLAQRKFLEISADNFDDRLRGMRPAVALRVPNTLTGEGQLDLEIQFESLDDFSPAAIARNVPALNQLLAARMQLANLIAYMDGKSGAEDLIAKVMGSRETLTALAQTNPDRESPQALTDGVSP